MMLLGGLTGLFGGAGAAAGTAAGAAGGALAGGFSLSSILQGTATVLGLVTSIAAGNAEGEQMDMQADDADAQQPLETLQGIQRRASIKREMRDSLGQQDTAYAASGLDLSFGTAGAARKDAFREADLALTSDVGTETTRKARLSERAANYRSMAKRARRLGLLRGISGAIGDVMSLTGRGGPAAGAEPMGLY